MHKTKRLPKFVQELDDLLTNPNKEMSNKLNEENVQAEKTKKMPYNLREKKIKDAAYRSMIRPELADELYQKIVEIVVLKKMYKDPNFSSKDSDVIP